MASAVSFVDDLCSYIADKTDFYYGGNNTLPVGKTRWLKAGEIQRDLDGVYAVTNPARPPDPETGVMYFGVTFWAVNSSTEQADRDLQTIYELFYMNHDFPTDNFYVFQSFFEGQIADRDRTTENLKLMNLSAIFYCRYLIS